MYVFSLILVGKRATALNLSNQNPTPNAQETHFIEWFLQCSLRSGKRCRALLSDFAGTTAEELMVSCGG